MGMTSYGNLVSTGTFLLGSLIGFQLQLQAADWAWGTISVFLLASVDPISPSITWIRKGRGERGNMEGEMSVS